MIVINSSPAINLVAALAGLEPLGDLYGKVIVPFEVMREIEAGAAKDQTADSLRKTASVEIRVQPIGIPPLLASKLDLSEAAVIQTALQEGLATVVMDDLKARRAARLAGLEVTGSLGVLVLAKQVGQLVSLREALERMRAHEAWLDEALIERALRLVGEQTNK